MANIDEYTFLHVVPIYFASTHGSYNVGSYPKSFIVPPNTYIFETASISEVTFTAIDEPLWTLMAGQHRHHFLNYFMNNVPITDKTLPYRNVFKNMHLYEPGDTMYIRDLSISAGLDEEIVRGKNQVKRKVHRSERLSYSTFGFFSFSPNSDLEPSPKGGMKRPDATIKQLEPLRDSLMNPSDKSKASITNEDFIKKYIWNVYPESKEGAIFIFSSCGSVQYQGGTKLDQLKADRYVQQIERHQHNQDLKALSKGYVTPIMSGDNISRNLVKARNTEQREGKVLQMFAPSTTRKRNKPNNNYSGFAEGSKRIRKDIFNHQGYIPPGMFLVYTATFPKDSPVPNRIGQTNAPSTIQSAISARGNPFFTEEDLKQLQSTLKHNSEQYYYVLNNKDGYLERIHGGRNTRRR